MVIKNEPMKMGIFTSDKNFMTTAVSPTLGGEVLTANIFCLQCIFFLLLGHSMDYSSDPVAYFLHYSVKYATGMLACGIKSPCFLEENPTVMAEYAVDNK